MTIMKVVLVVVVAVVVVKYFAHLDINDDGMMAGQAIF